MLPLLTLIPLALKAVAAAGAVTEVVGALAGPKAQDAAERVVATARAISGHDDPEKAVKAVQEDPAMAAALRQKLIDERMEYARLEVEDRKSARDRDVKIRQAGTYNWRADLMVVGCVVALCYVVNKIGGETIKPEVLAIFNMAVGALLKMLGDAFSFEFGSSRGSKEKDDLLRR